MAPGYLCTQIFAALIIIILFNANPDGYIAKAQNKNSSLDSSALEQPKVRDPNLKIELVSSLPGFPTNMAFIGADDILILSKNDGQVFRIKDGKNLGPVLKVDVNSKDEMGLLGIATEAYKYQGNSSSVFLYYSLCSSKEDCNNFLYKYEWIPSKGKLEGAILLLKLPGSPGPSHIGGEIIIGPDGYIYLTVGELLPTVLFNKITKYNTQAQNYLDGVQPDGRAGILRITQDGKPVGNGIIGSGNPLNLYYAYGIKNSFGIGFDPVSTKLWDTENGPTFGDEINLVEPGFNGGWSKIQGHWGVSESGKKMELIEGEPDGLVDFGGKGKYYEPKLVWDKTVSPTALIFLNSAKLGTQYLNDLFVGSVEDGRIFHLELNKNRTDLALSNSVKNRILDESNTETEILFSESFGIVTDLQVGPSDGFLYVVSGDRPTKTGAIYRIVPK